jgi:very-short-patch-repair endonuclease
MSLPEVILWRALRRGALQELRFRRQHPIEPYVLDFYCPAGKLAIEVDGLSHDFPDQALRDEARDRWLTRHGLRVLRFPARDVLSAASLDGVLATILEEARPSA